MSNLPSIQIKTNGMLTEVFINGTKVKGIKKLSVSQEPGTIMRVSLDLITDNMTIDGEMMLDLPEVYRAWYTEKEPSEDGSK